VQWNKITFPLASSYLSVPSENQFDNPEDFFRNLRSAIDCKETHFAMFLPLFIACYPRVERTGQEQKQITSAHITCTFQFLIF
jgi:hypothetical protein